MHGTLDIRRIDHFGTNEEIYQVRYEDLAGDSFTGSMNRDELRELLYEKLALNLTDEELDRAVDRLRQDGDLVFPEIEVREEELTGAGLRSLTVEG
ncbi:MAG TPA: hypothetical protein VG498_01865 [Terriglobales bacterium]|nr:hypothetical protein [Terriglobales bacterium]